MSFRTLAAAPLLLLAVGCAESDADDEAGQTVQAPAAPVLTGEGGFQIAVACHAMLTAVARLFSTIANNGTGAEQLEMTERASSRNLMALDYRTRADSLALELGRSTEDVQRAVDAAATAIDAQFEAREFEDFAAWLGAEADKCPPLTT